LSAASSSACQVIAAAIYKHPHGQELRVFPGDERDDNLLHLELADGTSRRSRKRQAPCAKYC